MILYSKGSLMGSKFNFHGSIAHVLSIHFFLSILSVIHSNKCEMLLGIVKKLSDFAKLAQIVLELLLGHIRGNISDVKTGSSAEFSLRSIHRGQFMCGALNLLESHDGGVTTVVKTTKIASTASATTSASTPSSTIVSLIPASSKSSPTSTSTTSS